MEEGNLIYKQEAYKIIGCCMEVHSILGKGFNEVVYKDALEIEFQKNNIPFKREVGYKISYKEFILSHNYNADFVVYEKMILEAKAIKELTSGNIKQTLNYLAVAKMRLALLVNFGEDSLRYKRVVL